MDKDEALWVESKHGLDSNSELESISLINMAHPSLEEALDEITLRVSNPRKILHIQEETSLELEKEDDIDEHGSYFMNTSSNPCSHEKSPESIGLSNIATHKIFNPLILSIYKDFERVVVDAFVYHKYSRSHCVNLEIGTQRIVLEGKPLHQLETQFEGFPRTSFYPKTSTFGRYHKLSPFVVMPL